MGTTKSREDKVRFIMNRVLVSRNTKHNKRRFIAKNAYALQTSQATIKEIIDMLEKAGRIKKETWKHG